jgi:predicted nucleic acid-binding protein
LILVDTSIWVDHLRRHDGRLSALLEVGRVLIHPFIVGEIACGSLADRDTLLELLQDLPKATVADPREVLLFIDRHRLHGKGIGYVDVHLLAAVSLTHGASLWTNDKRLRAAAQALGMASAVHGAH